MSLCGTPSFNDHLDYSFVVFKHIQQSFLMRKLDVWGNTINTIQYVGHPLRSLILVSDNGLPRSIICLNRVSKDKKSDPTSREQESCPISIQRPKRWFQILLNCEKQQFVSCTSNLLEQMYDCQKLQCSSRSGFWIFKISCEVRVLKQSQSALFGSISHMTILFVFTRMMIIWNQSIQAFVTSFSPFCYGSCELIYWPQHIRSSNSCPE